jgi:hypothetical protein
MFLSSQKALKKLLNAKKLWNLALLKPLATTANPIF